MRNRNILSLWALILGGLLMSCVDSPLLHHTYASSKNGITEPPLGECPLYFTTENLCASIQWTVPPSSDARGEFTLTFWNKESSDRTPQSPLNQVSVKLWMPSMGHGSSPVQIHSSSQGSYQVSDVFFVMPGEWEIWVQLKQGTSVVEQVAVPIKI